MGYDRNSELITKRGILHSLSKLNERTGGTDATAVSICRSLVATLRTFCEDENVNTLDVATEESVVILANACAIAPGDSKLMYDVSCVLYHFATHSSDARANIATQDTIGEFN
jgi:ABC-type lipoprotein export system ATPase subunit